ncbi:hypothetical protein EJB05_09492, partial [Eragrostis curvula]
MAASCAAAASRADGLEGRSWAMATARWAVCGRSRVARLADGLPGWSWAVAARRADRLPELTWVVAARRANGLPGWSGAVVAAMAAEALVRLPLRSAPPWARLPPSSAPYSAHGEMPLLSSSAAVATSQVLQAATPQQKHGLVLDDSDSDNKDGTSSFSVDPYADEFVPETEPQDLEGMAMLSRPAGQTGGGDGVFAPNSGTTETDAETEDENETDDTDDHAPSPDVYWNDYELTILRDCIPGFKGKSLKCNLECHPLSHLSHAYYEKSQGQVTDVVLSLSLLCIQVWNGIPSLNCDMHIMTRVKWRLHVQVKDVTSSAYHRHLYTSMAHNCCSFRFLFCFHVQIELHGYEWQQGNGKI